MNPADAPGLRAIAYAARMSLRVTAARCARRRRATLALLLAVAALAQLPAAPSASASATDAASARAYVRADLALVLAAKSRLRTAEAAPLRVLAQVSRECPHAAAGSPQDAESTQMSDEVIGAMVLSAYHLDVPALQRFVSGVARLPWSDGALRRTVRAYAANLRVLARLAPPHLCADVRAWVAGGYRSLPAATAGFDRVFMPAWVSVGMMPARLARYASSERAALTRIAAIEQQITDAEARAVENWGRIMDELGLNP